MSTEVQKFKNLRRSKLAAFNRKQKHLQGLLDSGSDAESLEEALVDTKDAFTVLEEVHDKFVASADEEALDAEGDYLEVHSNQLDSMKVKVKEQLRVLGNRDKFESAKIKFQLGVQNFGSPSTLFSQLSAEKSISFADMRLELDKAEKSFETVKVDMMHIAPTADHGVLINEYTTKVVEEVDKYKKIAFQYMKEIPPPTLATGGGGTASPSGESGSRPFSTTKRETMMLPHFSGDIKLLI